MEYSHEQVKSIAKAIYDEIEMLD